MFILNLIMIFNYQFDLFIKYIFQYYLQMLMNIQHFYI